MEKHGAAAALYAAMPIVRDHNHEIVEVVVTPHAFGAGRIREADIAVVVSIPHSIAPAIVVLENPNREYRAGAAYAVCTIENADKPPCSDRSCAITFTFEDAPA